MTPHQVTAARVVAAFAAVPLFTPGRTCLPISRLFFSPSLQSRSTGIWRALEQPDRVLRAPLESSAAFFFFKELQGLVHAIVPGWFDRVLVAFDYGLVGVHPSLWLTRFASPALNDSMQFAYMTHFLYLVILPAILYVKRERLAFWTVRVSTAIAHDSVYVIAVLVPVESPYYSLAALEPQKLAGGYCTAPDQIHRTLRARPRRGISFGTRRRLDGRNPGVMALQAMAFLAVLAVFCEQVRGDCLPTLSLCRGRSRRPRRRRGWILSGNSPDAANGNFTAVTEAEL